MRMRDPSQVLLTNQDLQIVDRKRLHHAFQEDVLKKNIILEDTPIKDFYRDQTIFITGATGFLGTLLVEKILRSCPQVEKLILLIRNRGVMSVDERLREYFSDEIFDNMRLNNPNYAADKIDVLCGALDMDSFGLSPTEEEQLIAQTTVIFHVAATVRFDEHIRSAYNINVKGTQTLIAFAKKMPKLKSFVYISTAFSNCENRFIKEEFYSPTLTADELSTMIEHCTYEEMALLNEHMIGAKPNTYTLTKATAEDIVRETCQTLPICVFRPSLVFPTLQEPLPIWTKGFNAYLALCIGNGMGLLRVVLSKQTLELDIVPADRTIDAMLTLAWYQTIPRGQQKEHKVYNYVSCNENKVYSLDICDKLGTVFDTCEESNEDVLWRRSTMYTSNITVYFILMYLLHCIPAVIFTLAEKLMGRKPRIMKLYRRIVFLGKTLAYFTMNDWQFASDNMQAMVAKVTDGDRKWCNPSMSNFSWEPMFACLPRSMCKYMVKKNLTKEHFQKNVKYIFLADSCLQMLLKAVAVYVFLSLLAKLLNMYWNV